jgi:hypothetical protein
MTLLAVLFLRGRKRQKKRKREGAKGWHQLFHLANSRVGHYDGGMMGYEPSRPLIGPSSSIFRKGRARAGLIGIAPAERSVMFCIEWVS